MTEIPHAVSSVTPILEEPVVSGDPGSYTEDVVMSGEASQGVVASSEQGEQAGTLAGEQLDAVMDERAERSPEEPADECLTMEPSTHSPSEDAQTCAPSTQADTKGEPEVEEGDKGNEEHATADPASDDGLDAPASPPLVPRRSSVEEVCIKEEDMDVDHKVSAEVEKPITPPASTATPSVQMGEGEERAEVTALRTQEDADGEVEVRLVSVEHDGES